MQMPVKLIHACIVFNLFFHMDESISIHAGCPSGYYGKDCAKMCTCGEGGQCHPVTGRCICGPGRMGLSCEQGNVKPRMFICSILVQNYIFAEF